MFPRNNHDQHDFMNHNHDRKIPTGFIKVDNQIVFTKKFAQKPIQIYKNMVNVLKQLENTERVNQTLKTKFNERENHEKKSFF